MRYDIIDSYSDYDHLIEMPVSPQAKKTAPYLGDTWQARLILIPNPKGEIRGFITSCVCPKTYTLKSLIDVYWQRWEIEQSYGELKQYQLSNKPVLRSLKREGVYQEIWGILTSYNIVRLEIAAMAKAHKVAPLRISFINALYLIQDEFLWCSGRSPGTIPKKLKNTERKWQATHTARKKKAEIIPESCACKNSKISCQL